MIANNIPYVLNRYIMITNLGEYVQIFWTNICKHLVNALHICDVRVDN